MADTKISALPAATTPLAGTEVLPIVQGGVTEKVAVDDLTVKNVRSNATSGILQVTGPGAGTTRVATVPDANWTAARTDTAQSFTGDQTLSTGNLVIGTSGKGIDFSATPGTGTSELFADYEEGTFTPVLNFGGGTTGITYGTQAGRYTKVGRVVSISIYISLTNKGSSTGAAGISGLPFTVAPVGGGQNQSGCIGYYFALALLTGMLMVRADSGSTTLAFAQSGAANAGGVSDTNFTNTSVFTINLQYDV